MQCIFLYISFCIWWVVIPFTHRLFSLCLLLGLVGSSMYVLWLICSSKGQPLCIRSCSCLVDLDFRYLGQQPCLIFNSFKLPVCRKCGSFSSQRSHMRRIISTCPKPSLVCIKWEKACPFGSWRQAGFNKWNPTGIQPSNSKVLQENVPRVFGVSHGCYTQQNLQRVMHNMCLLPHKFWAGSAQNLLESMQKAVYSLEFVAQTYLY